MRASQFIGLCFYLTLTLVAVAAFLHFRADPVAKDAFVLLSPVFFNLAARRAVKYRKAAVVLALLGVVFAAGAVYAGYSHRVR